MDGFGGGHIIGVVAARRLRVPCNGWPTPWMALRLAGRRLILYAKQKAESV